MRRTLGRLTALARFLALGLLLVAAWLLVPSPKAAAPQGAATRVVVLDTSASVRRTRPDWTPWARAVLAEEARRARAAGEELAVVCFASDVTVRFGPGDPGLLEDQLAGRGASPFDPARGGGEDDRSRLAAALRVASALVNDPLRCAGTVVVVSDAERDGPDPEPLLAALVAQGAGLEWRAPPAPRLADLGLTRLAVPRRVEAGAPILLRVDLRFLPGLEEHASAALHVTLTEGGLARTVVHPLQLPADGGRWSEPVALGPAGFGRTEIEVKAVLETGLEPDIDGDPVPENDRLRGSFKGEANLVIGVVAAAGSLGTARRTFEPSGVSALAGLEFVFLGPAELGTQIDDLDLILSFDLALSELPGALVEAFVRAGGGLFVTGGWRLLADWIPGRVSTPLGAILPMEPASVETTPRDVVLLVDGSGSMAGEPFEMVRAAAVALVGAALPSDRLTLRFFTTGLEEEFVLRERLPSAGDPLSSQGEAVAERLLEARVPGGQTMILRSLRQFAQEYAEASDSRSGEALLLFLSDGRERDTFARPAEAARETLARLSAARTRLAVIAVGEDYDRDFLDLLAGEDGEVAYAESLSDLESIFRRSIGGARIREGEISVQPVRPAPGSLAAEILGSGTDERLPPLQRMLRNTLVPGAELLWSSDRDEPVLAAWRVGTGRAAHFASLPHPAWAPAWTDRVGGGEPRPFGPLLRWLARSEGLRPASPELFIDGRSLVLSGLTGPAAGVPDLVSLELFGPSGSLGTVELAPRIAPSGAVAIGSRFAELGPRGPAEADLEQAHSALLGSSGPAGGAQPVRLVRATSGEFRGRVASSELIERYVSLARESPRKGSPAPFRSSHPLAPWVLGTGLLVLFLGALAPEGRQGITATGR